VWLPDVDTILTDTVAALHSLRPAAPRLVHGDLIAANVLGSGAHATAVLDFGFLSTAGDPAFDAAIAASCFDMWGSRARDGERELEQAFVSAFEQDRHRYSIYRAAYALTTACCFGTDLSEGHFAW
jgi:aminoglycoside phosphotransferase (APT) family kinase protein